MKQRLILVLLVASGLILSFSAHPSRAKATVYIIFGGSTATPSPTPTPTATPTGTPTPSPTNTPSPVPTATTAANTYYVVASGGSDSNPGTVMQPFATIQKACNVVTAGQKVVIGSGTYTTSTEICNLGTSGTSGNNIVFQSQTNQGAILTGGSGNTGCASFNPGNTISYITIQGFVIEHFSCAGVNLNGGSNGCADTNTHITVIWNHFTMNAGQGLRSAQCATGDVIANNEIDTSGYTVTTGFSQVHGLYLSGGNYQIYNNLFHDNDAGWDIQIACETPTGDTGCTAYLIYNNTFGVHNNGAGSSNLGYIVDYAPGTITSSLTATNNIFLGTIGPQITCYPTTTVGSPTITINYNLAGNNNAWTNCSSGVVLSNLINLNPQFVSSTPTGPAGYLLQPTSPAINAGTNLSAVLTTDFWGVTRPQSGYANYTIGAFEYPY